MQARDRSQRRIPVHYSNGELLESLPFVPTLQYDDPRRCGQINGRSAPSELFFAEKGDRTLCPRPCPTWYEYLADGDRAVCPLFRTLLELLLAKGDAEFAQVLFRYFARRIAHQVGALG